MSVFLSHKKEDKDKTIGIAEYLRREGKGREGKGREGIVCYVDAFDPYLQTTDDITNTLMNRVKSCTHLMAVVSNYTEKSWWVPFEIGVASEIDRRITSFQLSNDSLPEFLTKWPILKSKSDLDSFIRVYKQDQIVDFSERKPYATSIRSIRNADQFHHQLKASLGQ